MQTDAPAGAGVCYYKVEAITQLVYLTRPGDMIMLLTEERGR